MASVTETSAVNISADTLFATGSFIVVDECLLSENDEATNTSEKPKKLKESASKSKSRSKSRDKALNTASAVTNPDTPTAFIRKPLIYVSFNEKSTYDSHRESFVRFLESKLRTFRNRNCEVKEDSEIYTIEIVDKSMNQSTSMFMVDKTPTSKKTSVDIPNYATSSDVLDHNSKESCEKKKMRTQRPANTCFNCDGSHSLRDCPKPKNMSKINKARGNFNKRAERYHCDIEQKFGHIKPGQTSIGLREALGLEEHDIPMYIYGMRTLGYPPAWLNDAKITHSGLALFDSEGQVVLGSDEDEGEIENVKDKYDVAKLIDFPGFNVDPPKGTLDKSRKYGLPPMMPQHKKEAMIQALDGNILKGYKRRKLKMNPGVTETNELELSSADMEIDDGETDGVMPLGVTVYTKSVEEPTSITDDPNKSKAESGEESSSDANDITVHHQPTSPEKSSSRSSSPSIETLKRQKQELLAEICESSVFLDTSDINSTANADDDVMLTAPISAPLISKVLKTDYGTPILESCSPFSKLPKSELWSKGVSDVINFENLPDSTGKYERMKSLIVKVREHVTKYNSEV